MSEQPAPLDPRIAAVIARIRTRSRESRAAYEAAMRRAAEEPPARAHLGCGNLAHVAAAAGPDQDEIAFGRRPNIGVITAYNDMLSAHRPYEDWPERIRAAARAAGATAQVAAGVPAMCDGVTQGRPGMELSLFSREVIAMAAAIGLSHDCFDAVAWLGVCDKIVPGMLIAAARFGHLPSMFLPSGPMTSGLPNDEKAKIREAYAAGRIGRRELLAAELRAYHGPGTCTFYGTANTNQLLLEVMGLMLPGAAFVHPHTSLRQALTEAAVARLAAITALGPDPRPLWRLLTPEAFVNAIAALMATGGSTNLVLHLTAVARAAGVLLEPADFADVSAAVPLIARVYPNGLADVNQFHAAGGTAWVIGELRAGGLLSDEVETVIGRGLAPYAEAPRLGEDGALRWEPRPAASLDRAILRPLADPFQPSGGLVRLTGNLGEGVIKVSAVAPELRRIRAPARVFDDPAALAAAFRAGALEGDAVIVVRFQGPRANGMPELHGLTPMLGVLLGRGQRVALLTDGRMSGASGKVPAAIHVSPEAAEGGPLARLRDGDLIEIDAEAGTLSVLTEGALARPPVPPPAGRGHGLGRELFALMRAHAGPASAGATVVLPDPLDPAPGGGAGEAGAAVPLDVPAAEDQA